MHSFIVVELWENASIGIIADEKGEVHLLFFIYPIQGTHKLCPLITASCASYLLKHGADGAASYRLRLEPLGHLTIALDRTALVALLNTLKHRCHEAIFGSVHTESKHGYVSPEVVVLVQPFFVVIVQMGNRMNRTVLYPHGETQASDPC